METPVLVFAVPVPAEERFFMPDLFFWWTFLVVGGNSCWQPALPAWELEIPESRNAAAPAESSASRAAKDCKTLIKLLLLSRLCACFFPTLDVVGETRTALEPRATSAPLLGRLLWLGELCPIYLYEKKYFIFANKDSLMKAASVLFIGLPAGL